MHYLEPRIDMEDEANIFGGCLILPEEMLNKALANTALSFATLPLLKKQLKASMAAILFRLKEIDYISQSASSAAWRELHRLGWKKREPYSIEREIPSRFRSLLADIPSVCNTTGMSPAKLMEVYGIAA